MLWQPAAAIKQKTGPTTRITSDRANFPVSSQAAGVANAARDICSYSLSANNLSATLFMQTAERLGDLSP